MQKTYKYIGCFLPFQELWETLAPLQLSSLERLIAAPHVTFVYHPEVVDETLFGKRIPIRAVSYGNNKMNEGLGVELYPDDPELIRMAGRIAVPHITLSLSKEGKAVDTGGLSFTPIEPIELAGVFGGFRNSGDVVLEPPENVGYPGSPG